MSRFHADLHIHSKYSRATSRDLDLEHLSHWAGRKGTRLPAYAKDGHVVCFFQSAHKFKARYATFGFSDKANLDEGTVWPVAFALKELTAADEARIVALVKKAAS